MRIGFVVDGQAEFRSLPNLLQNIPGPHKLLNPLYADLQPLAPARQVAAAAKPRLVILASRGAELAVLLIDREERPECPSLIARSISQALRPIATAAGVRYVAVVVKNKCFENWLLSDPSVFRRISKRFRLTRAQIRSIVPNKADHVAAQAILKHAARGAAYSKVGDAVRILAHSRPEQMARNSRSFRRLLRVIGHPDYEGQSAMPREAAI